MFGTKIELCYCIDMAPPSAAPVLSLWHMASYRDTIRWPASVLPSKLRVKLFHSAKLHSLLCVDTRSEPTTCQHGGKYIEPVPHIPFSLLLLQTLGSLQRLSTALNILEKYGCNLTNPNRPKYWRTVKHNNPVFRATVDAIQVYLYNFNFKEL